MENYKESNLSSIEDLVVISNALKIRVNQETIPNYKHVITQISKAFEEAIESDDARKKKELLKVIENYENYLGEKYRDDADQRSYISSVKEAMNYLRSISE